MKTEHQDSTHYAFDELNSIDLSQPSRAKRDRAWKQPITYLALVLVGGGIGIAGNQILERQIPNSTIPPLTASIPASANPIVPVKTNGKLDSNFITNVVEKVGPAVVRINATRAVNNPSSQMFGDPFFQQFFGDNTTEPPSKEIQRGVGSGFIISANGEILTNAHVVDKADTVTVTLKDGRTFNGQVMGADPVTDVAVVKIDATNLPTATLGNSDQLQPGEWTIAIGNPLGLDNTVTQGILSATSRSSGDVGLPNERVKFLQTDAAINPGNSGGPLLNAEGQVIGINTAIIQNAQGLGFAIPINRAKAIADQLISTGKVEHPYLGVQLVTLTPEVKDTINKNPNSDMTVEDTQGVLIVKVQPDSPADQAGIRSGDVITTIDNKPVKTADEVQQAVENSQIGNSLQLKVKRNGAPVDITVKSGQLSASKE